MATDRFAARPDLDLGTVGIWSGILDAHPTSVAQEAARAIEAAGFRTLWIPEAVGREPFVVAANLLAGTETLKIATGIANIYARDPMTMASAQKTVAEAYPGRFLLGMGVSHKDFVTDLRNHDYSKPLTYMRAYLDAMDASLFLAHGPTEPLGRVIAALGPKMLELAAARADGAHPYLTTPEHTAEARAVMGAGALLAPEQKCVLSTDPIEARAIARKRMAYHLRAPNYLDNLLRLGFTEADFADGGSDRLVDAIVVWGTVDQIEARVQQHLDAGADHVCLQALRDDTAVPLTEWRELGAAFARHER